LLATSDKLGDAAKVQSGITIKVKRQKLEIRRMLWRFVFTGHTDDFPAAESDSQCNESGRSRIIGRRLKKRKFAGA
jgi:hypothetical protein